MLQVGKAMSSNESEAYKIMTNLDVDYVLVIFGGVIGYSGDDINKFLWMVRIAEGEHPKDIQVFQNITYFESPYANEHIVGEQLLQRERRIPCRFWGIANHAQLSDV